jgi:hypothetical protein
MSTPSDEPLPITSAIDPDLGAVEKFIANVIAKLRGLGSPCPRTNASFLASSMPGR